MTYEEIIDSLKDVKAATAEKKRQKALTEAMDIISDYEKAVVSCKRITNKYETAIPAIWQEGDIYTCRRCQKRITPGHSHCHWCGGKMSWSEGIQRREKRKPCK